MHAAWTYGTKDIVPVKAALDVAVDGAVLETCGAEIDELQLPAVGALEQDVLGLRAKANRQQLLAHCTIDGSVKTFDKSPGQSQTGGWPLRYAVQWFAVGRTQHHLP